MAHFLDNVTLDSNYQLHASILLSSVNNQRSGILDEP
jgi:hypothetical protein